LRSLDEDSNLVIYSFLFFVSLFVFSALSLQAVWPPQSEDNPQYYQANSSSFTIGKHIKPDCLFSTPPGESSTNSAGRELKHDSDHRNTTNPDDSTVDRFPPQPVRIESAVNNLSVGRAVCLSNGPNVTVDKADIVASGDEHATGSDYPTIDEQYTHHRIPTYHDVHLDKFGSVDRCISSSHQNENEMKEQFKNEKKRQNENAKKHRNENEMEQPLADTRSDISSKTSAYNVLVASQTKFPVDDVMTAPNAWSNTKSKKKIYRM